MSLETLKARLWVCLTGDDGHRHADEILCEALRLLGGGELVDIYERVPREFWIEDDEIADY